MQMNKTITIIILSLSIFIVFLNLPGNAGDDKKDDLEKINKRFEALDQRLDQLAKAVDDILWYDKVGDVAIIDKVFIVGPPPAKAKNPTAMGLKIRSNSGHTYSFQRTSIIIKNIHCLFSRMEEFMLISPPIILT